MMAVDEIAIFRIGCGRIAERRIVANQPALLRQLGAGG